MLIEAQVLKERRVYYLDCSTSMEKDDLFDKVRDNLIKAIDKVQDQTTELYVIPFAFDGEHHHNPLPLYSQQATPEGKAKLKAQITSLKMGKSTRTFHCDPLYDFYNGRVDNNKVTYMFLMTDGQCEDPKKTAQKLLNEWGQRYGNKNVFGFYVTLKPEALDSNVQQIIHRQPHLWLVNTADVDINLIRIQSPIKFNAKNDKTIDLQIYGDTKGKNFTASFNKGCPYTITGQKLIDNRLSLKVKLKSGAKHNTANYPITIRMTGGGKFDFLVTEKIDVQCEYKKERTLKIRVL